MSAARSLLTVLVCTGLMSACASPPPAAANPDGLSPQALALASALRDGCLPYMLGEASEAKAMSQAGMRKVVGRFSYPDPSPTNRLYSARGGAAYVSFEVQGCLVGSHARASDYRHAVDMVLRERFGPVYAARLPSPARTPLLPNEEVFCQGALIFMLYPTPSSGYLSGGGGRPRNGFHVDILAGAPACGANRPAA